MHLSHGRNPQEQLKPISAGQGVGLDTSLSQIVERRLAVVPLPPAHADNHSPRRPEQFLNWFGSSKVVDEDGRPILVFHGTKEQFDSFRDDKFSWFTEDKEDALDYEGAQVIEAFISIRNPADLDSRHVIHLLHSKLPQCGLVDGDYVDLFALTDEGNKVRDVLEEAGFDGIRVEREDLHTIHWGTFRPNQVKSATCNVGAFDSTNPSIYA